MVLWASISRRRSQGCGDVGSVLCFPHFHSPGCVGTHRASGMPVHCGDARSCTTEGRNTHKSEQREVLYRWHPWHGERVWIQGKGQRGDQVVFRCVRDELNCFPVLEIPAWMFDLCLCSQMRQNSQAYVSSTALLELRDILSTATRPVASSIAGAQHLSGSSGDADANLIMVQPTSGRVVLSTSEAAAVAAGSSAADAPPVSTDVARAPEQTAWLRKSASGGGR